MNASLREAKFPDIHITTMSDLLERQVLLHFEYRALNHVECALVVSHTEPAPAVSHVESTLYCAPTPLKLSNLCCKKKNSQKENKP